MGVATASDALQADGNVYARVWHFVQRQLHLRPRAASCPDEREARSGGDGGDASPRTARRRPRCLSEDAASGARAAAPVDPQWRRVAMLKQVEAVHAVLPAERARRRQCYYVGADQPRAGSQRARVQGMCGNCGALFFRSLAGAQAGFCGRDCQSSFEYRRLVQDAVDAHELRAGSALTPAEAADTPRGVAIERSARPPAF